MATDPAPIVSAPDAQKEDTKPPQETPSTSNSWFPDARKALIAQILSILVIPITVAVTIYMTDFIKKPKPNIEYYASNFPVEVQNPPDALATKISASPRLTLMYRDELGRMMNQSGTSWLHCAFWIDGGAWDGECLEPFTFTTKAIQRQLQVMADEVARHNGKLSPSQNQDLSKVLSLMVPDLAEVKAELLNVAEIRTAFEELSKAETPRVGSVTLSVGVLNSGDADGTLDSSARLKLPWGTMHVFIPDGKYVVVKAHSFEEVSYETAAYDGVSWLGTVQQGEEELVKKLSEKIRKGEKIPITIAIELSKQPAKISGKLDPQG
jgi:hypothetical protein